LQDSFAAGHLIDKTGVMQSFTKWLDANNDGKGYFDQGQSRWAMASMIANKELKSNPQAVDNQLRKAQANGQPASGQEALETIGLDQTDPEIVFMMWWRDAAATNSKRKHLTPIDAATFCPLANVNMHLATTMMDNLVTKKFAKKKTEGWLKKNKRDVYSLDQAQVNVIAKPKVKDSKPYDAKTHKRLDPNAQDYAAQAQTQYGTEAQEFNLAAYNEFVSNAYIQGATKFFHDKYCKEGLEVKTGTGASIGRIYGDANMLNAGAQEGVEYSAKTSEMSRNAIFNLINGTQPEATTAEIRNRFPTKIKVGNEFKSLADWSTEKLYTDDMFKQAKAAGAYIAYKFKDGISGRSAIKHDEFEF
jgi:hypothetical protein